MKVFFRTGIIFILAIIAVSLISLSGCQLQAADKASLTVSAAPQFGARGFYGDVEDVDGIDVYIYSDPANSGASSDQTSESGGAGTSSDSLVALLHLTHANGWTAEAPDIPTMTDLRIEAYAYGDSSVHNYDAIGWNITSAEGADDADATGITMFTGTTSKYISSATATIYLVLRPYNDGSLQRLPRIAGMTSNLNRAELKIDFNDYGEVLWPDSSSSYEKWYWRIIESNGEVATSSFTWQGAVPEASIQFGETNTQLAQNEDYDIVLSYLFPDDNQDGIVEWYERVYWLEIANPQHNVLRQAFVMNPGSDTYFDVNFAPWIRNITAGRYDQDFAGDTSVVIWEADVRDDDESQEVRYLWILNLQNYQTVYGDLANTGLNPDSVYSDWDEWIEVMTSCLDSQPDLQQRTELSNELALAVAPLNGYGEGLAAGIGIDSNNSFPVTGNDPSVMSAAGSIFDDPQVSGRLYLLVFDGEFENGGNIGDNINGYDDYSWSYVMMEIDTNSFPSVSGGGLIVFE